MLFGRQPAFRAAALLGGAYALHRASTCKPVVPAELPPPALFSLQGRTALVTGGSKGLGKAIARGLAQSGCDVVISARSEPELQQALAEILEGTAARGQYVVCDLNDAAQAASLGPEVLRRMGRCDILVNNAGVSRPECIHGTPLTSRLAPLSEGGWQTTLQTNLSSAVTLTNALAPAMVARGWGRIINVSSIGGLGSSEGRTSYTATKAALIGITHTGALELGPHGVTVNCVCPGPFLTDMPKNAFSPQQLEGTAEKIPVKRWGQPHELCGPVLMLASEAGSYVNGAVLRVDGGLLSRAY